MSQASLQQRLCRLIYSTAHLVLSSSDVRRESLLLTLVHHVCGISISIGTASQLERGRERKRERENIIPNAMSHWIPRTNPAFKADKVK